MYITLLTIKNTIAYTELVEVLQNIFDGHFCFLDILAELSLDFDKIFMIIIKFKIKKTLKCKITRLIIWISANKKGNWPTTAFSL
jgi:hypothetical protein